MNQCYASQREACPHADPIGLPRMHRRRKVNCLCRCSPQDGIQVLEPQGALQLFEERLSSIRNTADPHQIADRAIQTGRVLQHSGRPRLALELMEKALRHLLATDEDWQRYYAHYGELPSAEAQWGLPWSWRTCEVDARRLAGEIDAQYNEVNRHLGIDDRPRFRQSIHRYYEHLWSDIYEVCFDLYETLHRPHDPLATFRKHR